RGVNYDKREVCAIFVGLSPYCVRAGGSFWAAVASVARHRFTIAAFPGAENSAVVASLCRRTPKKDFAWSIFRNVVTVVLWATRAPPTGRRLQGRSHSLIYNAIIPFLRRGGGGVLDVDLGS